MTKTLSKLGTEKNPLHNNKRHLNKPVANIIFNDKRVRRFSLKL